MYCILYICVQMSHFSEEERDCLHTRKIFHYISDFQRQIARLDCQ